MARPNPWFAWFCVFVSTFALAACAGPSAQPAASAQGARQEARQSNIDCHSGALAKTSLCRAAGSYRDTEDGGDDPGKPGCHVAYRDAQCSVDRFNSSGDICMGNTLFEWTNTACHIAADDVPYDCDDYCRSKGHVAGECTKVENVCSPRGSAYCKCTNSPA
ncbi:hypothetical protein ACFQRC_13390 [Enterovirga sp. GCM10030262]|uniref:hypothetical protein n=1 Tax=Enterovirga sp. GCM10030262 TaxID=3273391 RepID=UPI0036142F71